MCAEGSCFSVRIMYALKLQNCVIPFIDAYKKLCHPSPGDITQVNECALRADICGNGRCIDTPDGYQCECYPGYQKGESEVCEGQSSFHIAFV
jgi:EGF-like domain.